MGFATSTRLIKISFALIRASAFNELIQLICSGVDGYKYRFAEVSS
jgi:hypothetical protein